MKLIEVSADYEIQIDIKVEDLQSLITDMGALKVLLYSVESTQYVSSFDFSYTNPDVNNKLCFSINFTLEGNFNKNIEYITELITDYVSKYALK